MSFTSIVKNEASNIELNEEEKIAELSAIILSSEISVNAIKIYTENSSVARKTYNLIKDIFNVYPKITVRKGYNYNKNLIYIIEISNSVINVLDGLGLYDNGIKTLPKNYIIDDFETTRAFLSGIFLINGSVNDPKKSRYHLEFLLDTEELSSYVVELLNTFNLNSKYIKRDNKYMVYIKEAEKIGDFLRIINASNAVMYFEDIRIYRDHKNMTNRLNNMEQANVDKMVSAAAKQIKDIETINTIGGFDLLDDKTKLVAEYRLKYPEVSLQELSEIISYETNTEITKSGVNHKIKKIQELASKIRETSIS